jgi:hypothetical protein
MSKFLSIMMMLLFAFGGNQFEAFGQRFSEHDGENVGMPVSLITPTFTPAPTLTPTPVPPAFRCHLTVGTRGPGNFSIYGTPRDKGQKRKIYVNWIHVQIWEGAATLVDNTIYVDPCNRNYGNIWRCADLEGIDHPNVRFRNGQITFTPSNGVSQELLTRRINSRNQGDRSYASHYYAMFGSGYRRAFRGSLTEVRSEVCSVDDTTGQVSPLVVDLSGKGITFTDPSQTFTRFDFHRDSLLTAWLDNTEEIAFVGYDANENGVIDSVDELFGDRTQRLHGEPYADGFQALSTHDSNGDKMIDSNDPIFSHLLLWKDVNKNGVSDEGELASLSDVISSLSLVADGERYFEGAHGSFAFGKSLVAMKDGSKRAMYDAWFAEGEAELFSEDLAGEKEPLPVNGTAEHTKVLSSLQELLAEDGFAPHEAPYSTGSILTVTGKAMNYKVARWAIGPFDECTAQVTFDTSWNALDRSVSCRPPEPRKVAGQ